MFLLLYSIKLVVFLRQRNDDAEKHDSRESENLLLPLLTTLFRKVNDDGRADNRHKTTLLFCKDFKKEKKRERKECHSLGFYFSKP